MESEAEITTVQPLLDRTTSWLQLAAKPKQKTGSELVSRVLFPREYRDGRWSFL
jgi:hypothetical protein